MFSQWRYKNKCLLFIRILLSSVTLNLIDYQRFGTDLTKINYYYSQVNPTSETEFNRHWLYKGTT